MKIFKTKIIIIKESKKFEENFKIVERDVYINIDNIDYVDVITDNEFLILFKDGKKISTRKNPLKKFIKKNNQ
jgi:hypothetical protein